jgi:WD40 repeat protein
MARIHSFTSRLFILFVLLALAGCKGSSTAPASPIFPIADATATRALRDTQAVRVSSNTPTLTPSMTSTMPPTMTSTSTLVDMWNTPLPVMHSRIEPGNASRVEQLVCAGSCTVNQIVYSQDGKFFVTATSDGYFLYNPKNLAFSSFGTGYVFRSISISPDGTTLASGSNGNTIGLWNVFDGTLFRTLEGHLARVNSVAFSPEGALLASGSDDNSVRLWSVSTAKAVRILGDHWNPVSCVAFSPDGTTLAAGLGDSSIRL